MDSDLLEIVPTKAMLLKGNTSSNEFKVTVFESHKSKVKDSSGAKHNLKGKAETNEFDLKKAKHEVLNFGISGLESKDKKAAKIALALKLGAKPPKNQYKNYKDLIAENKKAREEMNEQAAFLQLGKNAQGGASVTYKKMHNAKRKKKLDGQITRHYGVVNPKINKKKKK